MHSILNTGSLIGLLFIAANSSAEPNNVVIADLMNQQCSIISEGKLLPENLTSGTPAQNSYLFNCSIAVTFPSASKTSGASPEKDRKAAQANKIAITNQLLTKEIDVNFTDEQKNTLLHNLALSYLDKAWKVDTAKKLLALGTDKDAVNDFGDKAAKYARLNQQKELTEALTLKKIQTISLVRKVQLSQSMFNYF